MGTIKLLPLLILLAFFGVASAQIPTTLFQYTFPSSPYTVTNTSFKVQVGFVADYNFTSNWTSKAVPNATVILHVDGVTYNVPYGVVNPKYGEYGWPVNLTVGNHTWYFTASAPNFQSHTGPTQRFVINPYPTTLRQTTIQPSPQTVNSSTSTVQVGFVADYNATYNGSNFAVLNATVKLYVDGVSYTVPYGWVNPKYGEYGWPVNLTVGTHTWYFTANASNFQSQTGATRTYTVTLAPSCGNGVCESGETCSTCPADCGPCVVPTKLTQSVTPASGTAHFVARPTFICGYYRAGGSTPVTGATVYVAINSGGAAASYSASTGDYRFTTMLSTGNYTWSCIAFESGYQPQQGPTQHYEVK